MNVLFSVVAVLSAGGALLAQSVHEVVVVEQRGDIPARDKIAPLLRANTMTLRSKLSIQGLCKVLATACADKVTFTFAAKTTKADAIEALDLDLVRTTPLQVLGLVRELRDLQAVWRAGCVFLVPKAEVKEAMWLEMYDVRAEVMPLRDFPGPDLTLTTPGQERRESDPEPEAHTTTSGFGGEQLATLLREHAARGTWDDTGASIVEQRGILLVRQTERGHREVRQVLVAFGIPARATPESARTPAASSNPAVNALAEAPVTPSTRPASRRGPGRRARACTCAPSRTAARTRHRCVVAPCCIGLP